MADISKCKQTRGTIKATLTNIRKFADERTKEPAENQALNKEQIETRLEKLERAWNEFHDINDTIAILSNESQQVENDAFEDSYYETQAMLKQLLKTRTPSIVPIFENHSTGFAHNNRTFFEPDRSVIHGDIRLPRLKIQSFDGNYSEWPSFYDQYVKAVHNNESMTNVNKFHYLKTLLEGDAAKLLRHLPMTEESYIEAWDKLLNRFDRKKNIIKDYIELFMNLPHVQQSCTSLRALCDVSDQAIRGIRSLGKEWEGRDPWLLYITTKKLDPETQQLWAIHSNDNKNPTITDLLQFLSQRCDALECTSTKQQPTVKPRQSNIKSHAATNETTKFNSCPMCNKNHPLYRYFKFKGLKPLARRKFVLTNQLCGNCFRVGHFSKNCESDRTCLICAEKHSTLLHIKDNSTNNHTMISAQSTNSLISGTINNQQPSIKDPINTFGTADAINEVNVVSTSKSTSSNESKILHDSKDNSDSLQATCATTSYICEEFSAQALLSTVQVNIIDGSNTMQRARVLLDSGSQSTLITESLAQRLKLKRFPASCVISGLSAKPAASARGCMKLQIASIYSNENRINVEALILPKLTSQIPARQINKSRWNVINNLKLDDPSFVTPGVIDMILGNDVFFNVLLPEQIVIQPNIIAQHTLFGWVIGGKLISSDSPGNVQSFHITTTTNHDKLNVMEKFWQLEEIVVDRQIKPEDQLCEDYFKATTQRNESGRFLVRLPFKESAEVLGSSYINAERRLLAMERKFTKQPQIAEQYRNFMEEYIALGHMERIPEDKLQFNKPHFYLPHHAVCKASSTTTKLRVVFDGSYIEKMYRQVKVQDVDCDFQRILWRDHPSKLFEHYRLKTVTYGINSAPFLAIRTMIELANIYESTYPKAASILRQDFYVDDMLTGCEDYETATIIYRQISKLLAEGGFNIRKWISNDQNLLQTIPVIDQGIDEAFSLDDDPTYYKTLGLHWNPFRDCFSFKVSLLEHIKLSKRSLLSEASRVYDPLGLLAPITVKFKMLFQEVWKRKIDWDQELPCDIAGHWTEIKSSLKLLETLQISRCLKIAQPVSMELHIFCDTSQKAYGSAAYLKTTNSSGNIEVRLIIAKSRVAPLETTSLPRLELCAAVLGTKLYKYLQRALNMSYNNVYAWTDSQIILAWLADHPSRWKNFVANRTAYIRNVLPEVHWNHIESKLNPADHASRGLTPRQLLSNALWWSGPEYLQLEKSDWPISSKDLNSDIPEQRKVKLMSNHLSLVCASSAVKVTSNICEHLFKYYSSLQKIYRIKSFVCRFHINKLLFRRNNRNVQVFKSLAVDVPSILPPNVLEIAIAENICVRWAQYDVFKTEVISLREKNSVPKASKLIMLNPFIDKNQIMRVGGRLSMSDCEFDAKHPIILPKDHIFTKHLIKYLHEFHLHVGASSLISIIRQKYWIVVGCRNMVRRQILRCVKCFKLRKHQNAQIMGNLPEYRVTSGRVFMHTGVDYAGPIWIRDRSGRGPYKPVKGYIALFVCTRVKAIHIEVVSSLTTEAFIMALQRFIARRGKPVEILSDNGSNFVGARKELDKLFDLFKSEAHFSLVSNFLTPLKINFRFIPARSPHFGGLWEANIKSYKYLLQRSMGTAPLTFEQLHTVSSQIEAILNSRPICALSESPDSYDALTPGHFLIGSPLVSLPEPFVEGITINRLSMYQNIQQRVEIFWKRWSKDYLTSLQQRSKWQVAQPNIKLNQLVLIKEDNLPKGTWLIGKIINVYPGNDGKVRVATIKTPKGEITRSIVKLVPLPIDEHQTTNY